MNGVQLYKKGLASYEKYCKVCRSDCGSANGDAVKLKYDSEGYHLAVFKGGRHSGALTIDQDPFCPGFIS